MDSNYPASALRSAAEAEGTGLVLNERYTFEEYIHRRGTFLGKQPEYAHLPNACFIARRHAAEVYPNDQEILHVKDVRAREIATRQDPLLPLPTTSNTQTIDGFATCPPDEVKEQLYDGDSAKAATINDPVENGGDVAISIGTAHMVNEVSHSVDTDHIDTAPISNDVPPSTSSPTTVATSTQAIDTSSTLASSPGSEIVHAKSTTATAVPSTSLEQPPKAPNGTQSPAVASKVQPTTLARPAPSVNTVDTRRASLPREQLLTAAPGVAAMAGYGMNVPVKTRGKREHDEDDAETESVTTLAGVEDEKNLATNATVPPPKKKTKTTPIGKQAAAPADSFVKGIARIVKKSAANTKAKLTAPRAPAPPKQKATAPKPAIATSTPKPAAPASLNAIINGLALPKTPALALAASLARRTALLTLRAPPPPLSRTGRRQKPTPKNAFTKSPSLQPPNLMPEFFPPCTETGDDVHCICGAEADDGEKMVQCEGCWVWQHSGCLLPELTGEEVDGVEFLCQVCDPWGRRGVLRELRRREGRVDV